MKIPRSFMENWEAFSADEAFASRLDHFLETRVTPFFTHQALVSLEQRVSDENVALLEQYLMGSPLVFRDTSQDNDGPWFTRSALFKGKEFAVKITKMEIAAGIFIPASRCAPFANPRRLPCDFRFYDGKKLLSRILVDTNEEEVLHLYALSGEEYAPQLIAMDNPESAKVMLSDIDCANRSFPLKVVDMREFYWRHQVRPGDSLILTVKNWRAASFSVRLRKKDEETEDIEKWRQALWSSLEQSFAEVGPCENIEEQLAAAFFAGRSKLFSLQPDDILSAISLSPSIGFFPYGIETRIWHENPDFPVPATWDSWIDVFLCAEDEEIFMATGFPACEEVLYSYILDSFRHSGGNIDELLDRLRELNGDKKGRKGKTNVTSLRRIISKEFAFLHAEYNVFEDKSANLRELLVALYSKIVSIVRFCQSAGVSPPALHPQDVIVLEQFAGHIIMYMGMLCRKRYDSDDELPASSLEGMEELLGDIEISIRNEVESRRAETRRKSRKI